MKELPSAVVSNADALIERVRNHDLEYHYRYDCLDAKKYLREIESINKICKNLTGEKLLAKQANYTNIQTYLENKYQHVFSYVGKDKNLSRLPLDEDAIYDAVVEMLAITHYKKLCNYNQIQVRAIILWVVFKYFEIEKMNAAKFDAIFERIDKHSDVIMLEFSNRWEAIDASRLRNSFIIEADREMENLEKSLKRKAHRFINGKPLSRDLEIRHFMECWEAGMEWGSLLENISSKYSISVRTLKKRCGEIDLHEANYSNHIERVTEYKTEVADEMSRYEELTASKQFTVKYKKNKKVREKKYFKKDEKGAFHRATRFRTFHANYISQRVNLFNVNPIILPMPIDESVDCEYNFEA